MEKRKIDRAELDMEVQHDHSWGFPGTTSSDKGCSTSGYSSDCCWHDCTEYKNGGTGTARWIDCVKWATYSWSAFS